MSFLSNLQVLQSLDLQGTGVTDRGMAVVSQLKNLRQLNLESLHVTHRGVGQLTKPPKLERLHLLATRISDAEGSVIGDRSVPLATGGLRR